MLQLLLTSSLMTFFMGHPWQCSLFSLSEIVEHLGDVLSENHQVKQFPVTIPYFYNRRNQTGLVIFGQVRQGTLDPGNPVEHLPVNAMDITALEINAQFVENHSIQTGFKGKSIPVLPIPGIIQENFRNHYNLQ